MHTQNHCGVTLIVKKKRDSVDVSEAETFVSYSEKTETEIRRELAWKRQMHWA